MTACYIIVRELHGAASRMAFCRVKHHCCPVCHCHHWHHWCLSFSSALCTYWWLHLLLTSVSVIFYCMNVIVRWPECHQAMILWALEKNEFLAVRTCNNWCTLSIFLVLCQESIARSWLTKVIHLMNVICVHTLFCDFRVTSAECSPAPGTTKCLDTSDIGHMPPHDWDTYLYAVVV